MVSPSVASTHPLSQRNEEPLFKFSTATSQCTCTCRLYCLRYNPDLGTYEGSGESIPHSTRQRHRDDEKTALRRRALPHQQFRSLVPTAASSTVDVEETHAPIPVNSFFTLSEIEHEISTLEIFTAPHQLAFVHDPRSALYTRPYDLTVPNTGLHALKSTVRVNYPFLFTEHRFCDLLRISLRLDSSDRLDSIIRRIEASLSSLQSQKEAEWYRQRQQADSADHINTGELLIP